MRECEVRRRREKVELVRDSCRIERSWVSSSTRLSVIKRLEPEDGAYPDSRPILAQLSSIDP